MHFRLGPGQPAARLPARIVDEPALVLGFACPSGRSRRHARQASPSGAGQEAGRRTGIPHARSRWRGALDARLRERGLGSAGRQGDVARPDGRRDRAPHDSLALAGPVRGQPTAGRCLLARRGRAPARPGGRSGLGLGRRGAVEPARRVHALRGHVARLSGSRGLRVGLRAV